MKLTLITIVILAVMVPLLIFSVQTSKKLQAYHQNYLNQKIDERIVQHFLQSNDGQTAPVASLSDDLLAQKIEQGIELFVLKQRSAQQEAKAKRLQNSEKKTKDIRRVTRSRDHIYGNPDAEISLIEYSDFECPYCKRFHKTAKKIIAAYDGKVNWVYRHFPLGFHNPLATKEAEASECANELGGNSMFWKYTDLVYEQTKSNGNGLPLSALTTFAEALGLNPEKFSECLDSGRHQKRVQEDLAEGTKIGITGTPGNVFLHNKTGQTLLKSGAYPFETLKPEIDKMLNL